MLTQEQKKAVFRVAVFEEFTGGNPLDFEWDDLADEFPRGMTEAQRKEVVAYITSHRLQIEKVAASTQPWWASQAAH